MKTSQTDYSEQAFSINCNGRLVDLSTPKIMGILNLTPDSFSDGGKYFEPTSALIQTEKMLNEGAEIIDIGAQSTRPNAQYLSAADEISRIGNVISRIKTEFPQALVSLDTFHSEVVEFGYNEGLDIVNDISGGMFDTKMFGTVAKTGLPYILMHVNPTYEMMHEKSITEDIILILNQYFSEKFQKLRSSGVKDIILDPGFGFGKTVEQQHQIIAELQHISFARYPLLIGISRKSFIYKPLGKQSTDINVETQKLHLEVLEKGAKILRVHDVAEAKNTLTRFLSS